MDDDISTFAIERVVEHLTFDREVGPSIGHTRLLYKTNSGFNVLPEKEIETICTKAFGCPAYGRRMFEGLTTIARALNAGDTPLAAIATDQLRFALSTPKGLSIASLKKAGVDDPRPGWPAGTPGGRGGKFRPMSGTAAATPAQLADKAAQVERLKARRGVRAVLRRVLTAKRVARLFLEGLGEAVPVLDVVDTAAMIEDIAEIAGEIAEGNAEIDAAVGFVERGPQAIEDLMVTSKEETFPSFAAFTKLDLAKRFGSAGKGYEYHHIVEQSAGLDGISAAELNSTRNIVRIPTLLHEEITGLYARVEGGGATMRQAIRGYTFEQRRAAGLDALRRVGVLYP